MPLRTSRTDHAPVPALLAIVGLGATLRFATLGSRSFWEDEATTVLLMRHDFGDMLGKLPDSEGSPPLFYLLTWPWARLFGEGEAALRVLPAVWGVLTIPVMYLAARELFEHRAGLAAALLAAVSPQLVWHAQDVRAYSLFLLLSALSFLFFLRARAEPSAARLGWWAAASVLAVLTQYFAAFLLVAEGAALLMAAGGHRRRAVAACVPVGAAMLALVPLVVAQSDHGGRFLEQIPFATRVGQLVVEPVLGYQPPAPLIVGALGGVLGLAGVVVGWRALDAERRRRLLVPLAIGLLVVVLPFLLLVAGLDYIHTAYLLAAWPPLALVAAAALTGPGGGRAGPAVLALFTLLAVAIVATTAERSKFEHQDWRTAYDLLGPVGERPRMVVLPGRGLEPLEVYRPDGDQRPVNEPRRVSEVDVVLLPPGHRELGKASRPPRGAVPPPPGFRQIERREAREVTFVRFRAPVPALVDPHELQALAGDLAGEYTVVLEAPSA